MLKRLGLWLSIVSVLGLATSLVHFHFAITKCEFSASQQRQHIHDSSSEVSHDAVSCFMLSNLAKTGHAFSPEQPVSRKSSLSTILVFESAYLYTFKSYGGSARAPPYSSI